VKHDRPSFARRLPAVLLLAVAATAMMAQDSGWSKKNFGLQLGYMSPMGDLANMQEAGPSFAIFYEKVFPNGFATRGRLEYAIMPGKSVSWEYEYEGWYDWYTETAYGTYGDITQIGAMFDLIYYKDLKDTIYPFAGIGFFARSRDKGTSTYYDGAPPSWMTEEPDSGLVVCAGLGVNFSRHFGMELKYALYNWVQLSLLYRF
jgi:hypothetical protein